MKFKIKKKILKICFSPTGTEENFDIIDESAIYLLRLLLDAPVVMIKHLSQMKKMFGQVPTNLATKICSITSQINSELSDECRQFLQTEDNEKKTKKLWGNQIKFNTNSILNVKTDFLQDLTPPPTTHKTFTNFSMKYQTNDGPSTQNQNNSMKNGNLYNRAWLSKHVNPDLINTFIEMLKSSKSNDELQNELFDMLGFDKFEVIQEILINRKTVIQKVESSDKKVLIREKVLAVRQTEQRPQQFGCQVIVQSEQEKLLLKQSRKDEKKLRSLIGSCAIDDESDDDEFNPAKLRQFQQQSLLQTTSQSNPIFNENRPKPVFATKPKYPFVFDSHGEAKAHIGFIAGAKLVLSDNVERIDTKMYEEVRIPATESTNLTVGNERIKISSLDEIGQIAFKGTKELNRIQTIVYPVAYNTNENLLVCAPTGAGKTNVAMLTIIHTIRTHADQGVIHRDQFKIVYVAPMKALAAEMVTNFGKKLQPLGISVRELTGDMQLTKIEMQQTQMLVTTPEKWDVVTRKGAGDVSLINLVKLLIIDEVISCFSFFFFLFH